MHAHTTQSIENLSHNQKALNTNGEPGRILEDSRKPCNATTLVLDIEIMQPT